MRSQLYQDLSKHIASMSMRVNRFFPIRAGGFNFSLARLPLWVRIGTSMLRPQQSLELVEIIKKFARTWGCKLDLKNLAPPEPRQTGGKLPSTYERLARAGCRAREGAEAGVIQHPRRPACADLSVRVPLGTRLCPVSDRVRVSSSFPQYLAVVSRWHHTSNLVTNDSTIDF